MKFSSARSAIMWAWWMQFDCLVCSNPLDPDHTGGGMSDGNVSGGFGTALDIKRWLERAAFTVGLESIDPILLSALPQKDPVNLLPWQQRKVDDALNILECNLRNVGWLEEKCCIPLHELL